MQSFNWKKLGKIFNPSESHPHPWMYEYALAPSTLILDDIIRVFFSCRPQRENDGSVVSYSAYIDLDKNDIFKILDIANKPVIPLGELGTFDEYGVVVTSVIKNNHKVYAYYIGWSRMQSVPYATAIGVIESLDDGKTFSRISEGGPIITPSLHEPYREQACPIVKIYNNTWHMWYMTGLKWIKDESINKIEPVYQITHATSTDGLNWTRQGIPIIPTIYENECQTTPNVFYLNGIYHMFFSYRQALDFRTNRNRSYRIGYAWSEDLITWQRDDSKVGIDVSENGWDSEMICYPYVFELNKQVYMFYCGNNFGKEGFGAAILTN